MKTQTENKEILDDSTLKESSHSSKGSLRNSDQVKRGNGYKIHVKDIDVDFTKNVDEGGNPRTDYGTPEDYEAFKDSIREKGVMEDVFLYSDPKTGNWTLHHGYRRVKAAKELFEEENLDIWIPFTKVSPNEEERIVDHFVLNNGKNLTQLEKAEGLKRLMAISQITNISQLAKRVHLPYNEVFNLVEFIKGAATPIKTSLRKNEISYDVAQKIVKKSEGDINTQKELLEEGKNNAGEGNKIRAKHISKIREATMPYEVQINLTLLKADSLESVDMVFLNRVKALLKAIKENKTEESDSLLKIQK